MSRRFYSEIPISEDQVALSGDEAKHIVNVNRLGVGDDIVLFDGSGKEFEAKIQQVKKNQVSVCIERVIEESRELQTDLTLAVALPKGDRQKVLVEKLVELGVNKLIPINCSRSVAIANDKTVQRLDRRVIEASKQCGRNVLMQIESPLSFDELIERGSNWDHRIIAHPEREERELTIALPHSGHTQDQCIVVAIGPEGGFATQEVDLAVQSGWQAISIAPTILRVETAAVAAAVLFGIGNTKARMTQ